MMAGRAAMIAALERRVPPGPVPLWELEFHAWDAAAGHRLLLGREFEALSGAEKEAALRSNAEIITTVAADLGYAAVTVPNAYWHQAPGQLAYWCLPEDWRFRQAAVLRKLAPPDLYLVGAAGSILGANYTPEFCYLLVDDPAAVDVMARDRLRNGIDTARRWRDCGVDAVVCPADIADNSGPFYNPAQMDRWILPCLDEWSAAVHDLGLHAILHSDGDLTRYLDVIADTGLDALQALDTVAGMDMCGAKDIVGSRLCLCGNIDCGLLLTGTPETVYAATRDLLLACRDRAGFVLGASNAVQREVPLANYHALVQAWRDHGIRPATARRSTTGVLT